MRWLAVGLGVAMLWGSLANANAQVTKTITMRDACDPVSFNAALGTGACVPGQHGNTLFTDFLGELQTIVEVTPNETVQLTVSTAASEGTPATNERCR
jgi:hypothetical protein